MFGFLEDVGVEPIVAVNKTDKIDDLDERLDGSVIASGCTRRGSSGLTRSPRSARSEATSRR